MIDGAGSVAMTAAALIMELQKLDPDTVILTRQHISLVPATIARVSGTEYSLAPVGKKKAAIVPAA